MKNTNVGKIAGALAVLILISIGASYAYFTATITGSETATTVTIGSGTLGITYAGGSAITASNIYPRSEAWVTKNFTITGNNTTDTTMSYKVALTVASNTFSASALKWQLTSTNTGSNGTPIPAKTTNQNIAAGASSINLGTGSFTGVVSSKVHTYVLTIYFPDTSGDQNTEQGKSFTARLVTTAA